MKFSYISSLPKGHNHICCKQAGRFLSSQADLKKYSESLCLPKTSFPIKPNVKGNNEKYFKSITSDLYEWQKENLNKEDSFVLLDGPPFANGRLHIGHALNKILKDIINRWQLLKGRSVHYVPGWDCHGLPIESKAIKANAERKSSLEIRKIAKDFANSAVQEQLMMFQRMAVMGDWPSRYITMSDKFEIAELKVFLSLLQKDLIFRQNKPVYWSSSSRSALAESEIEYDDNHVSTSIYFTFPVNSFSIDGCEYNNVKALVWTTTPWTIPSNLALSYHPEINYGLYQHNNSIYLMSDNLVPNLDFMQGAKRLASCPSDIISSFTYENPLLPKQSFPFLQSNYVTNDIGTGIVHVAPGHGMEDYLLGLENNLRPFSPLDDYGQYTKEALDGSLEGLEVLGDGGKKVISIMKNQNMIVKVSPYKHRYPYDWRTHKPLILRATPQWFISLENERKTAIKALDSVKMIPPNSRARLLGFLNGRPEWCISRQRAWGLPIPVLYEKGTKIPLLTVKSVSYIIEKMEVEGVDSWFNDTENNGHAQWVHPDYRNKEYIRGTETLDVWFDSGTSWTTIAPRKNKPLIDLCLEGSDQHRGWFQSLLLTYTAYQSKPEAPFSTLFTHGFIFDERGQKQSKSLGNVTDPEDVINGKLLKGKKLPYGVDLLRLWVASCDSTNDTNLGPNILTQVGESLKKWRLTSRFCLGNLHDWNISSSVDVGELRGIDKLALVQLDKFQTEIRELYESYSINKVVHHLNYFMNSFLSSTYFDAVKDRLYADLPNSVSRRSVQTVLYHSLLTLIWAISPITPLLAQEIWQSLPDSYLNSSYQTSFHAGETHLISSLRSKVDLLDRKSLIKEYLVLQQLKYSINLLITAARENLTIKNSLEAYVVIKSKSQSLLSFLKNYSSDLPFLFNTSKVFINEIPENLKLASVTQPEVQLDYGVANISLFFSNQQKCLRCWMHTAHEDGLCDRCESVLAQLKR